MKIHSGTKFYKYDEESNTFYIIRVRREIDTEKIKADENNISYFDSFGKKKKCSLNELLKNYHQLAPDGTVIFSIARLTDDNPKYPGKFITIEDVIVAIQKRDGGNEPYAVCRQAVYDIFTNSAKISEGQYYCGISISKDTCPTGVDFKEYLGCDSIRYNKAVSIYMDDTLDDILAFINQEIFDKVLVKLKAHLQEKSILHFGLSTTVRGLLSSNSFMYDFRRLFNIVELPFAISDNAESIGDLNTRELERIVGKLIERTYVMPYSKAIDLSKIKRNYVLASAASENYCKLYIVGFDLAKDPELSQWGVM